MFFTYWMCYLANSKQVEYFLYKDNISLPIKVNGSAAPGFATAMRNNYRLHFWCDV